VSVRFKYTTEKGVDRKPVEVELEIPAEMVYRLVHTMHDELQDPESIKNWEMIAMMFTRLIQHLAMQKQMTAYRPNPFFAASGFPSSVSPIKSVDDVKKFLEAAMGEIDDKQKFDDIFKDDKTDPEELRRQGKKFKSVKVEDPEDKEKNNNSKDEKK
jgi:hypothetical protein